MRPASLKILILLLMAACSTAPDEGESSPAAVLPTEHWPTPHWAYDTADHARFEAVVDSFPGRYSMLVVNDGKIAFEHYQEPYAKDSLIHVNSCTKTVIAMLFGAVFQEQAARHAEMAAIDYFPAYPVDDPRMQHIQVQHFLSMSSGLDWKGGIDASDVVQMSNTGDWAEYVFQREVVEAPGERFHYNSGGSQVVATLLHQQTQGGLMAFAEANLFKPLGISAIQWDRTPRGVPKAGWGLHLKLQDLAKLGHLLLKKGRWKDVQVVPAAWVAAMSSQQIEANDLYDYGYQVWIPKDVGTPCFMFRGSYPPSTKIVAVLPELNSVLVYVGENYDTLGLLRDLVVPALREKANDL